MVRSNAFPTHDTSNPPPMQSVRKLSLILSGEKTLRTKRLTELLNQPIIYVKQKGNVAQITQRAGNNCEEAKRFLDAFYGVLEDALVSGEVVQLIQGRVFLPYARFQVIIDLITIQNSPLIFCQEISCFQGRQEP